MDTPEHGGAGYDVGHAVVRRERPGLADCAARAAPLLTPQGSFSLARERGEVGVVVAEIEVVVPMKQNMRIAKETSEKMQQKLDSVSEPLLASWMLKR